MTDKVRWGRSGAWYELWRAIWEERPDCIKDLMELGPLWSKRLGGKPNFDKVIKPILPVYPRIPPFTPKWWREMAEPWARKWNITHNELLELAHLTVGVSTVATLLNPDPKMAEEAKRDPRRKPPIWALKLAGLSKTGGYWLCFISEVPEIFYKINATLRLPPGSEAHLQTLAKLGFPLFHYTTYWDPAQGESRADARKRIHKEIDQKLTEYFEQVKRFQEEVTSLSPSRDDYIGEFAPIVFRWLIRRMIPPQESIRKIAGAPGKDSPEAVTIGKQTTALRKALGITL